MFQMKILYREILAQFNSSPLTNTKINRNDFKSPNKQDILNTHCIRRKRSFSTIQKELFEAEK